MTALNALRTSDAVHIFTDGGQYDVTTGVLRRIGNKIHDLGQHNAVLALAGKLSDAEQLAAAIRECDFHGPEELLAAVNAWAEIMAGFGVTFTAVVAGWDDLKGEPFGDVFVSLGDRQVIHRPLEVIISPLVSTRFDPGDITASGLAIVREQRSTAHEPFGVPDGQTMFIVGGFAKHTVISAGGVKSAILTRWSDVIGEPIDASRAEEAVC